MRGQPRLTTLCSCRGCQGSGGRRHCWPKMAERAVRGELGQLSGQLGAVLLGPRTCSARRCGHCRLLQHAGKTGFLLPWSQDVLRPQVRALLAAAHAAGQQRVTWTAGWLRLSCMSRWARRITAGSASPCCPWLGPCSQCALQGAKYRPAAARHHAADAVDKAQVVSITTCC